MDQKRNLKRNLNMFELNEYENVSKFVDTAKAELRGKCIALNAHIRKKGKI